MTFMEKLAGAMQKNNSLVCVGLDPAIGKLPECIRNRPDAIYEFNCRIVDATKDLVCAYKPQAAYYAGQDCDEALKESILYINNCYFETDDGIAGNGNVGNYVFKNVTVRNCKEVFGTASTDCRANIEVNGGNYTSTGRIFNLDRSACVVSVTITGGTFIGTGAAGMAQTFSSSGQGVIAVRAGNISAGTQITLTDDSGNVLISHAPALGYNVVILSSPQLQKGQTYNLTIGAQSSNVTAN